ncbi:hypothetical protein [Hymenobacter yonginensis]|uniref:Bacterial surface antigen (D15) domain-containing protein n=1 Tax=Hymenobacter yonginensis TaxID=748197 RepID=A0ABY7PRE1_9BACT|nr:hypothetical protein [Hymenobacter yonginensis]WBO85391.1 hypothetical protein O9Z63_03915 [Hymenobacter yonginensis]
MVGGVLVLTRHRAWPGGSRRLLHLGLLLAGRFLIEFWRDPAGEQVGAAFHTHAGLALKQVQWALLLLVPLVLGAWAWLLYRNRHTAPQPEQLPTQNPVRNLLAVAGLLLLTAWLGPQALTRPEVLVVKALLLTVLVLEGGALLLGAAGTIRPARMALPLTLAAGVLVLTSQTPADSSSAPYFSFTPGYVAGSYDEDVTYSPSGGCSGSGGPSTRAGYYHQYRAMGGEAAYTRPSLHRPGRVTYGLGIYGGREYVNAQSLPLGSPFLTGNATDGRRFPLFDVNPFIARDRSQPGRFGYGVRVGLHMGHLANIAPENAEDSLRTEYVLPDASIWLGVRRTLFFQADYGNGLLALGNGTGRLALGSGLGSDWNRQLLAGVALSNHTPGLSMGFLSASFPVGRTGLWLEPYGATDFGRHRQVSLRVQYRLQARK